MNNPIKNLKIKVENLKKNYGSIRALKGISLEVQTGEVLVVIGLLDAANLLFYVV